MPKKRAPRLPPGYRYVPVGGFGYETGAAFAAGFWVVVAIPFGWVGRSTNGTVSEVFYGLAAFFALLSVINFGFYATGHNGGTNGQWEAIDPDKRSEPPSGHG